MRALGIEVDRGGDLMSHVTASDNSRIADSENYRPDHLFNLMVEERSAVASSALAAQRLSALGEMTGGIVHDFRNILAVIDSSLRLIAKSSNDPEGLHAFIAGARDGLDRGLRLTSQLLNFAKQRELEPQSANANELLKSLELFLKYGAGSAIRIVFELASDIPRCLIDTSQFNAAILNLVVNARDAMPNGGEIRISTAHCIVNEVTSGLAAPGAYVRLRVADNGKGMSAEIIRKVFQPFFFTKGQNGTGLGMSQVRAFMRRTGGYVNVTSELGRGTTIDLLFPRLR